MEKVGGGKVLIAEVGNDCNCCKCIMYLSANE
jgi:hypothetical protein